MIENTLQHSAPVNDTRRFGMLLLPSWASGILTAVISLVVAAGVITSAHFSGSLLEQMMNILKTANTENDLSVYGGPQAVTYDNVLAAITTWAFWAAFGTAVYFTVVGLVSTIRSIVEFRHELEYVHAQRNQQIRTAVFRLVIRIATLAALVSYIQFFFKTIVSSCLLWVLASAYSLTPDSAFRVLVACAVMVAALHVYVVLLRLLALRPRLFGEPL